MALTPCRLLSLERRASMSRHFLSMNHSTAERDPRPQYCGGVERATDSAVALPAERAASQGTAGAGAWLVAHRGGRHDISRSASPSPTRKPALTAPMDDGCGYSVECLDAWDPKAAGHRGTATQPDHIYSLCTWVVATIIGTAYCSFRATYAGVLYRAVGLPPPTGNGWPGRQAADTNLDVVRHSSCVLHEPTP